MNQRIDKEALEKFRDGAKEELEYEKDHGSSRHEPNNVPYWIGFWSGKVDAYQYLLDTYFSDKSKPIVEELFEEVK